MASIRQVAKEAGVSIATVSRVINGAESVAPKLRSDVLRAVEVCGYSPVVGRRETDAIALMYTGPFTIGSPYDAACLEGIVGAMRESPYDLLVIDIRRDMGKNETLQQFCLRKGIGGAIVRCTTEERPTVSRLATEGVPLVVLGDHFDDPALRFAYTESEQASRDAVQHLVSLGHRRIGFAACHRNDGDHADRLRAYCEVLKEEGIFHEDLIYRVPPSRLDGGPILRRVIGMVNRPTAMYIADPLVAAGVINEAHQMGIRIPDELSVIGFDDTDLRNLLHPTMSSVCQDSEALGRSAFKLVESLVDKGNNSSAISSRQAAWFEIHESTGPPPKDVQRILPTGSRLPAN